ncbi:putative flippase GtrA [Phycicoccus badiiscoriae]|uniref:Putative flippase GtrA n=1 Tax=Pedococcus badiiscoriae TaxID=642776 RepID=A0A852WH42_9MICO|nr:FUSC family protein [Pedococcus badiiscoriae]NYG08170.1 putative flippase GtrA [Pedococcus badiiscoriae]
MTQATPPRPWWAAVFDLGPHAGAHWTALRASLAIFVPLAACWASGRGDLLLYAAIGAFAALYGRHEPARVRLVMQAQAGAVLVVGVVIGALVATVPFRLWLLVPIGAVWAAVAVLLAESGRWHPAGALNPVFALTASATVPIRLSTVPAAALTVVCAAGFALLLALPGRGARDSSEPVPQRLAWRDLRPSAPVGRHAVRYLLGIGAAGLAVATSGIGHPYWTFVTASVPMSGPALHARLTRAAQRVVGTAAGLGVAALVLAAHPAGYAAILVIAAFQACTELTTGRNYSLGLVFFTPMALLLGDLMLPASIGALLAQRAVETVIGLTIALAATVVTHERRTPPSRTPPRDRLPVVGSRRVG